MILGTVASVDASNGITVIIDGEETASEKKYSYLASYIPAANDKVIIEEINGSYVILGKICTIFDESGQAQYAALAANATNAAYAEEAGHADTARVSQSCSGNASSATVAASCSGNAATATTASKCTGNSATATNADYATSAGYATNAGTASSCSGNAATATTASKCTGNSATADWAAEAQYARQATSATEAQTASLANRATKADSATTAATCTGNAATATVSDTTNGISILYNKYETGKVVTSVTRTWNSDLRTYLVTDVNTSSSRFFIYK